MLARGENRGKAYRRAIASSTESAARPRARAPSPVARQVFSIAIRLLSLRNSPIGEKIPVDLPTNEFSYICARQSVPGGGLPKHLISDLGAQKSQSLPREFAGAEPKGEEIRASAGAWRRRTSIVRIARSGARRRRSRSPDRARLRVRRPPSGAGNNRAHRRPGRNRAEMNLLPQ